MSPKRWLVAVAVVPLVVVGALLAYLLSIDVDEYRDNILARVEAATGRKATLGAPIVLEVSLHPAVVLEKLALANEPGREPQQMIRVERLEGRVDLLALLGGRIAIESLRIDGAEVALEAYPDGGGNWSLGAPGDGGGGAPALPQTSIGAASVRAARVRFRDAAGGVTTVAIERLDLERGAGGDSLGFAIAGQAAGVPFDAQGTAGLLAHLLAATEPYPIDASVRALGVEAHVRGSIARPLAVEGLALAIEASAANLDALAGRTGSALPEGLPFALKARIEGGPTTFRITDVEFALGENRLDGALEVATDGARPRVSGALHAKRLDLVQLTGGGSTPATGAARARVFSDAPIDFDALHAVDAQIRVRGDRVDTPLGAADDLLAEVTLADGALRVDPARVVFADSRVEGSLTLAAKSARSGDMKLALEARKLDVARLQQRFEVDPVVRGRADLSTRLAGRGGSVAAIMGSADGHIRLLMGSAEGRLAWLERIVGGVGGALRSATGGGSDWTPINCMAADFDVRRGIATRKLLLLDTNLVTLAGNGTIDLRNERLDLVVQPQSKSATLNLAVPIDVGGTLLAPTFTPNKAAAARRVGSLVGGLLFPPAALGAFADMGSGDEHPCSSVAATSSGKTAAAPAPASGAGERAPADSGVGGVVDSVTKGLKSLFGN